MATRITPDQNLTMEPGANIVLSGGGAIVGADIQAAAGSIGTDELANLAVTAAKIGTGAVTASSVPVVDASGVYSSDDVEACLTEAMLQINDKASAADLAGVSTGYGSGLVGYADTGGNLIGPGTVEATLDILGEIFNAGNLGLRLQKVDVVIGTGAATATSADEEDQIDATVIACTPIAGNDQVIASVSVSAAGAVTVTTADNETGEATFRVLLALSI